MNYETQDRIVYISLSVLAVLWALLGIAIICFSFLVLVCAYEKVL